MRFQGIVFSVACFLILQAPIFSQEKVIEVNIEPDHAVKLAEFTPSGNFYIMEFAKDKDYKTRYRAFDSNFNLFQTITADKKIDGFEIGAISSIGNYFTYQRKINEWSLVSDTELDMNSLTDKDFLINLEVLSKGYHVAIGKEIIDKKIKLFSNSAWINSEDVYSENHYMLRTGMADKKTTVFKIEVPEGCYFNGGSTKVLYHDNEHFLVSFYLEGNKTNKTYRVATYDYEGNLLGYVDVSLDILDSNNESFAYANLENGSFATVTVTKYYGLGNTVGNTDLDQYGFATVNAHCNIKYDPYEKAIYVYAGIKPKKGDSSILIYKYDSSGSLLWQRQHQLSDTQLRYLNSFNRYLSFDIYPQFIGVSVNSTKGKSYCDFYIVDKNTSEMIAQEKYDKYGFYSNSGFYDVKSKFSGLDSEYEKITGYKNLKLDRSIIYAALYSSAFREHLNRLNNDGEFLIKGVFMDQGLNTVMSSKKGNKITFSRFKL